MVREREVCNLRQQAYTWRDFTRTRNHYLDPKHEELEEGFDYYNCYAAPLATYLTYRLQLAKCSRNVKKTQTRHLVGVCTSLYTGILHQSLRLWVWKSGQDG